MVPKTMRMRILTLGLLTTLVLPPQGCMYSFRAGAGFPGHVQTVAVLPFELGPNVTRPELTDEIFQALLREFPRSQGLQPAGEDVADAVVTGTIQRYSLSTPSYRPGAPGEVPTVLQRQVTLVVDVEITHRGQTDESSWVILWEGQNISVRGEYLEDSQTEDDGRAAAIELLIQRIVDGAQSNW